MSKLRVLIADSHDSQSRALLTRLLESLGHPFEIENALKRGTRYDLIIADLTATELLEALGPDAICPSFLPKPFTAAQCRQILEGLVAYDQAA